MRSASSRRRSRDRNPAPVVLLGTAGALVVGSGLLAVPGGGAAATSGPGRAWLFALVLAAILGAMGAGDAEAGARRRSRRVWFAAIGLFTATLALPALVGGLDSREAALPLTLAAVFGVLLAGSLAGLTGLRVAEGRRARRVERARREKRAPLLARAGPTAAAASRVRRRRRAAGERSASGGRPGSRRARP